MGIFVNCLDYWYLPDMVGVEREEGRSSFAALLRVTDIHRLNLKLYRFAGLSLLEYSSQDTKASADFKNTPFSQRDTEEERGSRYLGVFGNTEEERTQTQTTEQSCLPALRSSPA